ncbi:CoA-transferase family III domain-containing protein [Xylariaceae sp. FL1019]|nr:CoA-transferase family III domain-containing protein [Xylariaceae sp. FL1019]
MASPTRHSGSESPPRSSSSSMVSTTQPSGTKSVQHDMPETTRVILNNIIDRYIRNDLQGDNLPGVDPPVVDPPGDDDPQADDPQADDPQANNLQYRDSLPIPRSLIDTCEIAKAQQDLPYFSIPLKETETIAALECIGGALARAIFNIRCKDQTPPLPEVNEPVQINLEHVTNYMMQSYTTVFHQETDEGFLTGSFGKLTQAGKDFMMQPQYDTDVNHAQSDTLNRLLGAIYKTKPGDRYGHYHLHQSLDAKPTLKMIDVTEQVQRTYVKNPEGFRQLVENKMTEKTASEWDSKGIEMRQAGVAVMTPEQFQNTEHGKSLKSVNLPWTVTKVNTGGQRTKLLPLEPDNKRPLQGVKVIEFCRIIAGPTIGRNLGEYGADVIKITEPNAPDVPWFHVDVNMGKECLALDLKNNDKDKDFFRALLSEADLITDGYSPGAIPRLLGRLFGVQETQEMKDAIDPVPFLLIRLSERYKRDYVYVVENCFGHVGEWEPRRGWQQISDCVTGVADEQGRFVVEDWQSKGEEGFTEPIVPPFPISDYGCASQGTIAALAGLYNRQTKGGSWIGRTSIVEYDLLLLDQGVYSDEVKQELRKRAGLEKGLNVEEQIKDPYYRSLHFGADVEAPLAWPRELKCSSSVDEVSGGFFHCMVSQYSDVLFDPTLPFYEFWKSPQYEKDSRALIVQVVKPVVRIEGLDIEHQRPSRPNAIQRIEPPPKGNVWANFKNERAKLVREVEWEDKSKQRLRLKAQK